MILARSLLQSTINTIRPQHMLPFLHLGLAVAMGCNMEASNIDHGLTKKISWNPKRNSRGGNTATILSQRSNTKAHRSPFCDQLLLRLFLFILEQNYLTEEPTLPSFFFFCLLLHPLLFSIELFRLFRFTL